jgi:hypothetical protein
LTFSSDRCALLGHLSAEVVPGVSDHEALIATLSVCSVRPSRASREVYNFEKADWKGLNRGLVTRLLTSRTTSRYAGSSGIV